MRAHASTEIEALDVRAVAALTAAVVARWRRLPFDGDGAVLVDGERREGLRLLAGVHDRPGARYRVVPAEPEPEPVPPGAHPDEIPNPIVPEAFDVEVLRSDGSALDVRLRPVTGDIDVRAGLVDPGRARALWVEGSYDNDEVPFLRGTVDGRLDVDLGALPGGAGPEGPMLQGALTHRRGRLALAATVRPAGRSDRWVLDVEVRGGRGVLRPLAAVAGPVAGWFLRRELRRTLVEDVAPASAELARELRGAAALDAEAEADTLVDGALRSLAAEAPSP
jgi:hypothetical protein